MQKILLLSFLFLAACATKSREPAMVAPSGALELGQALQQGSVPTLIYLRSQTSAQAFSGLYASDPAKSLPASLKAEKSVQTSQEKIQRQQFLRTFRPWDLAKKTQRGTKLVAEFTCANALESQALGLSLELDFPQTEAIALSQNLHEKVLTCPELSKTESLFRLAIFSIQQGDCPKAQGYLNMFSPSSERGVSDRLSYLKGLCTPSMEVTTRNPWGGYGILLTDKETDYNKNAPQWFLSASSGSEEWDRLLVSFVELSEKGKTDTIKYLAGKLNYEKFRTLPLSFQTSMLVLMNYSGADLSVFQTLHRYLADNPNMLAPSVAGLLFPIRYWKEIVENSKNADPILVKALIRQESAFNSKARSHAKAAGLMQLIFPTARLFGLHQPQELLNPEKNIQAGSEFLSTLIRDFGSVELALAAYNAGPATVRQWQKRYQTQNIDLFVEMIPYAETREYVRLVTRNYKIYQSILVKPQVLGAH